MNTKLDQADCAGGTCYPESLWSLLALGSADCGSETSRKNFPALMSSILRAGSKLRGRRSWRRADRWRRRVSPRCSTAVLVPAGLALAWSLLSLSLPKQITVHRASAEKTGQALASRSAGSKAYTRWSLKGFSSPRFRTSANARERFLGTVTPSPRKVRSDLQQDRCMRNIWQFVMLRRHNPQILEALPPVPMQVRHRCGLESSNLGRVLMKYVHW